MQTAFNCRPWAEAHPKRGPRMGQTHPQKPRLQQAHLNPQVHLALGAQPAGLGWGRKPSAGCSPRPAGSALRALGVAAVACLAGWGAPATASEEAQAVLRRADAFRSAQTQHQQLDIQVRVLHADGRLDKERHYTVLTRPERRSLVLMNSPAEKGQKVLMLGDDFWLLMPNSQRPLRITPMQKLLGEASTGDVASLSWSEDYSGTIEAEEPCQGPAVSGAAGAGPVCLRLALHAKRKGVSYQRITLWVGKERHEPQRAELFVQSDKLAKRAEFHYEGSGQQVAELRLQDALSQQKLTLMRYEGRRSRQVPENWFNPMFLARNQAEKEPVRRPCDPERGLHRP
jgi:hypothetical protein